MTRPVLAVLLCAAGGVLCACSLPTLSSSPPPSPTFSMAPRTPTPSAPATPVAPSTVTQSQSAWPAPASFGLTAMTAQRFAGMSLPVPALWSPVTVAGADAAFLVTTGQASSPPVSMAVTTVQGGGTAQIDEELLSRVAQSVASGAGAGARAEVARFDSRWGRIMVTPAEGNPLVAWVVRGPGGEMLLITATPAPTSAQPLTPTSGSALEQIEAVLAAAVTTGLPTTP